MQSNDPQTIENNLAFLRTGLSLIPIRLDGSKAAAVKWKQYQTERPADSDVRNWSSFGSAIVCGAISGGLEVIDFDYDAETVFPAWSAKVDSILIRLPIVETTSGGYHVYYRCRSICGSKKLALTTAGQVRIETRGEGALITSVTNPPHVHKNNYPYVQVAGPILPEIPTITTDERKELWRVALTFDQGEILQKRVTAFQAPPRRFTDGSNRSESARRYVAKMPPAIEGSNGHNQTFAVAKVLLEKFELDHENALSILMEYNERCEPPWSQRELEHKIRSAS